MSQTYTDSLGRTFELRERHVFSPHFHPRTTIVQEWYQVSAATAVAIPSAEESAPAVDLLAGIEVPDVEVPAGILSQEQRLKIAHHTLIVAALRVVDQEVEHVSPADFESLRKITGEAEHRLRCGDV